MNGANQETISGINPAKKWSAGASQGTISPGGTPCVLASSPAAFVVSGPAAAHSWEEYSYPEYAFSVAFPADPKIETTIHEVADGRSVPARVYSVRQDKGEFKMTVADLANTGLDEKAVIDHAIKILSANGEVKVNYPHRIYGVYGRQLSLLGKDGSRSMVAMFDIMGRLYQIEAKVAPGGNDIDLIRFQQSLVFDNKIANRTEEEVRAIRESCPGRRDAPFPPGGADDPRCAVQ